MGGFLSPDVPQESRATRLARDKQERLAEDELTDILQVDLERDTRALRRRFGIAPSMGGMGRGPLGGALGWGGFRGSTARASL